jgi:toxin ParE1/3/4
MAFAVVVSPATKQELAEAFDWYKTRSPKAANAFRAEVLAAFNLVAEDPHKWAIWDAPVRRYVLKQYPYTVYFSASSTEVRILAVGHHRRRANYWVNR